MVYVPVRSMLKLGDYLSVQAHKSCSISHLCTRSFGLYQKYAVITIESACTVTKTDICAADGCCLISYQLKLCDDSKHS